MKLYFLLDLINCRYLKNYQKNMVKINIEIDKLANSIVNTASGDVFNTEITE